MIILFGRAGNIARGNLVRTRPRALHSTWRGYFDPNTRRDRGDKPLVTGQFRGEMCVSGQIPVVLMRHVRGVGRKGQIVSVRRGYARHNLVPRGLAVYGTWENIDEFADPELVEKAAESVIVQGDRVRLPFDWINELQLRFVRHAFETSPDILAEPVSVWDILQELSDSHDLDLLPGNLDMPAEGLGTRGLHEIPVRIPFRSAESARGKYILQVELISLQSLNEEQRETELKKAIDEGGRFQLAPRVSEMGEEDEEAEEENVSDVG